MLTNPHFEVVERMLVDVFELRLQSECKFCNGDDVCVILLIKRLIRQTRGGHVGATDGLNLLNLMEPFLIEYLK